METNNNRRNTPVVRLYGYIDHPISEKDYKISFEALIKFITVLTNGNQINLEYLSKVDRSLMIVSVSEGDNCGGCYYDWNSKEAHGMSQHWAIELDTLIKNKTKQSLSLFSEEAYKTEKCEWQDKENWAKGTIG